MTGGVFYEKALHCPDKYDRGKSAEWKRVPFFLVEILKRSHEWA
jgi:hypothetical protein